MKDNSQPRHALKKPMAAASALLAISLLTACGGTPAEPAADTTANADAEIQALLPAWWQVGAVNSG